MIYHYSSQGKKELFWKRKERTIRKSLDSWEVGVYWGTILNL